MKKWLKSKFEKYLPVVCYAGLILFIVLLIGYRLTDAITGLLVKFKILKSL